jgi:fermentation-respiration switch protein FrsA (DUF1100 family)
MVHLAALVLLIRALPILTGLALALGGCTGLIFQPMRELVLTPDQIGLNYREVDFAAADGVRLHGWYLPARTPRRGSILFLHGNAQNISTHIASVGWLPARGFDVLLFDYRGYGRSGGSPGLAGLHLDFEAALETLLAWPGIDPNRVVVFGQSLGGSLAITALAASRRRQEVQALIVEGAFTSYRALATEKLAGFWLTWLFQVPLGLTIDDRYRPIEMIGELAPLPLLIVHGEDDQVVPPEHGIALYDAAGAPKTLWLVPGAGHIGAFATAATRNELVEYLARTLPKAGSHCCAATHGQDAAGIALRGYSADSPPLGPQNTTQVAKSSVKSSKRWIQPAGAKIASPGPNDRRSSAASSRPSANVPEPETTT